MWIWLAIVVLAALVAALCLACGWMITLIGTQAATLMQLDIRLSMLARRDSDTGSHLQRIVTRCETADRSVQAHINDLEQRIDDLMKQTKGHSRIN